jgi:hypothetical protein
LTQPLPDPRRTIHADDSSETFGELDLPDVEDATAEQLREMEEKDEIDLLLQQTFANDFSF